MKKVKKPVWALILWFVLPFAGKKSFASDQLSFKLPRKQKLKLKAEAFHLNFYHLEKSASNYLNLESQVDSPSLKAKAFAWLSLDQDGQSFPFSVQELYYHKKFKNFHLSLGRKIVDWTYREDLKVAASWNNAWDFNKSSPVREGLVGLFLEKKLKMGAVTFFISPVSLPKLHSHHQISGGQMKSLSPWHSPPPESIEFQSKSLRVEYELKDLDYLDLLSDLQLGLNLKNKWGSFSYSFSYLYGKSKELDLGIDFYLDANQNQTVALEVNPKRPRLHRFALDFIYDWSKNVSTAFSFNSHQRAEALPLDFRESYVGLGSGESFQLFQNFNFSNTALSFFFIENTRVQTESNGELASLLSQNMSVPYRFRRGVGTEVSYSFSQRKSSKLSSLLYVDFKQRGMMGRIRYQNYLSNKLSVQLAYEFIEALSSASNSFYKDFRENDFIYGGISYEI